MSELYVIRKHGGFYRRGANGYTVNLSEAWKLPKHQAEDFICVADGVTIHPVSEFPDTPQYTAAEVKPLVEALRDILKVWEDVCETFFDNNTLPSEGVFCNQEDEGDYRAMKAIADKTREALKPFEGV